jgi:hypothetical protein
VGVWGHRRGRPRVAPEERSGEGVSQFRKAPVSVQSGISKLHKTQQDIICVSG